jgi:hypothetical protein
VQVIEGLRTGAEGAGAEGSRSKKEYDWEVVGRGGQGVREWRSL